MKNDPRSCERNLCNCVRSLKNSGFQQGLNPWPRNTSARLIEMSEKKELAVPSFLSHLETLCIGTAQGSEPKNFCSAVKRLHSTDFGNVKV